MIRAAGPGGGVGVSEAMRAAGAQLLVQVMCTALVALRRLVEEATVRTTYRARSICSIVIAFNAADSADTDSEDYSDSD